MKFPHSILYVLASLLLLAAVTFAQDDLPDNLSTVAEATGRPEPTSEPPSSSTEPASTSVESTPTPAGTSAMGLLTGLPTIAGALNPTPIVPNTANAPYMQKSSLPEGTVFICVGAALGFLGACVLAWRGLVAWSLHRSAKRAALQYPTEKIALRGPSGGLYSSVAASSTMTLDKPNVLNKKHLSTAPSTMSGKPRVPSSLFFSPTAGPGQNAGNRSSSYLPAGYYAPGNSTPSGSTSNLGAGHSSLSLTPGQGYNRSRSIGPSPPGSPALPPSRGRDGTPPNHNYNRNSSATYGDRSRSMYAGRPSTSSLNLSVAPGESRAPSAYLEDLFENHGNGSRDQR